MPVLGYTWFPLFTMIDWRYRFGRGPVTDYRIELGLYQLRDDEPGLRWQPTPLVAQLREAIAHPATAIGPLAMPATGGAVARETEPGTTAA